MISQADIIQLRKTQLILLDTVHKICSENNLIYWIDFGTLLGAVRSKGFIPWDDDVDVSMPLKDYKKFLKISEKNLPKDIFLQTTKTDKFYKQYFAKIRDCYSTFLEYGETVECKYHHGIYIDIFPSVVYPKIPKALNNFLTYIILYLSKKSFHALKFRYLYNFLYVICKLIWRLLALIKGDTFSQAPEDNGYYKYIPISYLNPLQDIYFEGKLYKAPNKIHEYLTLIYGDYMTLPTVDKRRGHARLVLPGTPCLHPRALKKKIYE